MVDIRINNLTKKFGAVAAVDNLSIEIEKGEMVALLGPSGCGKTTLLRMIAGFETPSSGDMYLRDRRINQVPPQNRNIGIVFQDYAIFPTMSVYDNVAYGLTIKKKPKDEIYREVMEYLGLVGLVGYEKRMPSQLSGGQQQRVALARALITKPDVLLLDEPLSNLDAALRLRIRKEIRKIQQRLGITAVFVTHDQEEALSIADKIFVMRNGELMQGGVPREIYTAPANDFVASFIGRSNILYGKANTSSDGLLSVSVQGIEFMVKAPEKVPAPGTDVWLSIRPQFIKLGLEGGDAGPAATGAVEASKAAAGDGTSMNVSGASVGYVEYLGNFTKGEVRIAESIDLEFEHYHLSTQAHRQRIAVGDKLRCLINPEDIILGTGIRGLE
ncbi:Spermidine/putrescine import ATP-binding protein PotA [uncultured Spirochaetota bacterium]|jgi:ABC-type Fe3+/spermidine/putrescine transport system ATPase subunit|nr:Spermidine/putrescine import ATP-binding protein PotA [uncultured Spirochaetota bacterium]